jgi:hypothetical protein
LTAFRIDYNLFSPKTTVAGVSSLRDSGHNICHAPFPDLQYKTSFMKSNLSTTDRITRLIISAAIVVMFFFHAISGTSGVILLIIAAVLVLTALVSFCPVYFLLGLRTKKKA